MHCYNSNLKHAYYIPYTLYNDYKVLKSSIIITWYMVSVCGVRVRLRVRVRACVCVCV